MSTAMVRRPDLFHRLSEWLEVPEFVRWVDPRLGHHEPIKIEQRIDDDKMEIRAEVPGIDPDKDVEVSVVNGVLTISAERREEKKGEDDGVSFSEFRYGSFCRTLPVPDGTSTEDITATYKDGILSVTVPIREVKQPDIIKVPVNRN